MAHTVSRIAIGPGRAYNIVGDLIETVTDVVWSGAAASETATATELGLSTIYSIESAHITAAVGSATGVECAPAITAGGGSVALALNTVAAAGTGQSGTTVRVTAKGKP